MMKFVRKSSVPIRARIGEHMPVSYMQTHRKGVFFLSFFLGESYGRFCINIPFFRIHVVHIHFSNDRNKGKLFEHYKYVGWWMINTVKSTHPSSSITYKVLLSRAWPLSARRWGISSLAQLVCTIFAMKTLGTSTQNIHVVCEHGIRHRVRTPLICTAPATRGRDVVRLLIKTRIILGHKCGSRDNNGNMRSAGVCCVLRAQVFSSLIAIVIVTAIVIAIVIVIIVTIWMFRCYNDNQLSFSRHRFRGYLGLIVPKLFGLISDENSNGDRSLFFSQFPFLM